MPRKVSDFIFSFGFMVLGVVLLLGGSLIFAPVSIKQNWPVAAAPVIQALPVKIVHAETIGGDITPTIMPVARPSVPVPMTTSTFSGDLTAATAIVVDDKTNTVLFKKNSEAVRPLASITKLMSALVLDDLGLSWSTTTVITEDDADQSSHHVAVGEEFTLDDLWHLALIGSSNSAVNALVRASGLSEQEFVGRMNQKALDWHLTTLHFVEPTGLNGGDVGAVYDVARLLKEALKVERIARTLQIGEYYVQPLNKDKARRVWTTDWLLTNWIPNKFSKDDIVGKTGYTGDAGYNFVVRLSDKTHHAIRVVVLGATSHAARFSEARDLAEWAFSHYRWPDEAGYDKLVE